MQALFDLITLVRENILEKFEIGIGDITYWDFLIYLLVAGIVVTVLVNAVRVSSEKAISGKSNMRKDDED